MKAAIQRLQEGIDRHAHVPRQETGVEALTLFRQVQARPGVAMMYRPSLCVVADGRKQVVLGEHVFDLDKGHFLIVTVEVPVTGCVVAATPREPYLGLTVDLHASRIADLLLSLPPAPVKASSAKAAVAIAAGVLDDALIDTLARLVALLDEPRAAPVLAPLIERELHYRLVSGEHGRLLRQIATADSHLSQIAAATDWIREHHAEPMRIEELARRSAMSATSFHRHFKAVTMLTPLEYRTRIRLQDARRLMLVEDLGATAISLTGVTKAPRSSAANTAATSALPPHPTPRDCAGRPAAARHRPIFRGAVRAREARHPHRHGSSGSRAASAATCDAREKEQPTTSFRRALRPVRAPCRSRFRQPRRPGPQPPRRSPGRQSADGRRRGGAQGRTRA
jgi:AraC-like DNA-binding protein